jgi:hypothetical protein
MQTPDKLSPGELFFILSQDEGQEWSKCVKILNEVHANPEAMYALLGELAALNPKEFLRAYESVRLFKNHLLEKKG